MEERWENEQFFFDDITTQALVNFVKTYDNPCLLCAPSLGKALIKQGLRCWILDIDDRFSYLPDFHYFDLKMPKKINHERFGLILCDPPFFNVKFSHLFKAIALLCNYNYEQPLLINCLSRRSKTMLKTFSPFKLLPTGIHASYQNVRTYKKNEMEFFGNLSIEEIETLKSYK